MSLAKYMEKAWIWGLPGLCRSMGTIVWPLVFKANISFFRLFCLLSPSHQEIENKNFFGFGNKHFISSAHITYWKRAVDINSFGRFGYAWNECLGIKMSNQFYVNTITFKLYYFLGPLMYYLIGLISFYVVIYMIGLWQLGWASSLLFSTAVVGSPLIVHCFTVCNKPEIVWYLLVPLAVFLALQDHLLSTGLVWSILVAANFGAASMVIVFGGLGVLYQAAVAGKLAALLIGIGPGVMIILIRMALAIALDDAARGVARNMACQRTAPVRWKPNFSETILGITFSSALLLSGIELNCFAMATIVALCGTLSNYIRTRTYWVNDEQSFIMSYLTFACGFSLSAASWGALIMTLIMAYWLIPSTGSKSVLYDRMYYLHDPTAGWPVILKSLGNVIKRFPEISSHSAIFTPGLANIFLMIDPQSRVLYEWKGMLNQLPDGAFPSRSLWAWTDTILLERQVEIANQESILAHDPDFCIQYLQYLSALHRDAAYIEDVCRRVGARYFIALTPETRALLTTPGNGFTEIASFDLGELSEDERKRLQAVPATLSLLELTAAPPAIVSPPCVWSRSGNTLTIEATAGTEYRIRYRHSRFFTARQGVHRLAVESDPAFPKAGMRFMRVRAVRDGPLSVTFSLFSLPRKGTPVAREVLAEPYSGGKPMAT
jgi:hypothetical protein